MRTILVSILWTSEGWLQVSLSGHTVVAFAGSCPI